VGSGWDDWILFNTLTLSANCPLWTDWYSQSVLYYDRRSVGQSVLVSIPHLRLMTTFLLPSDNCGFVDMGRPLWREDGSVFYNLQYAVYITVSDLRAGPCIYVPQEQGGPVITPGTGISCRTLLYKHFARTTQKTQPILLRRRVYRSFT
jgi:hypothetical protein